ncbi:hypothetical protein J5J10_05815 [Ciceribacter sp. L1K23]|uniref:hypothetical protein n=1 Tax=unclassified Ciceribacter TaxID=2628820 RepID=UPI001ABEBDBC|nr:MULTISPECIES: hypothetical protein [unclassified Ciceribacter]MBO3760750.1 hypothetical protein [Ciceribacter sp. L1K22]MBR0555193.1 hypothetical protein [Ciceribacter sp. L1K23]
MRGLSFFCLATAVAYALVAMALGIFMAASHDHMLAPAHAHLNLVGWVSVALYGLFYHAVPAASGMRLAKVQVGFATAGVVTLCPGIALAVLGISEGLAVLGSFLTIIAMALFATVVFRSRARA